MDRANGVRLSAILIPVVVVLALLGVAMIPTGYAQPTLGTTAQYLPAVFKALPTATPTITPIPTQTPIPTVTPAAFIAVRNGTFESGNTDWITVQNKTPIIRTSFASPVKAHAGRWAAWLGGSYDSITSLAQTVTIPADKPYLSYWRWIASVDACVYADFILVQVFDDNPLSAVDTVEDTQLCGDTGTGGWVRVVYDLRAHAGTVQTIRFEVFTDQTLNSNVFIDDVSFVAKP
jgi:hypothetical protein